MKAKIADEVIELGKYVREVVVALLFSEGPIKTATKFLDPKFTVKATHHRRVDNRDKTFTLHVTCGRPNYAARQFIKLCKKAGVPFPVRKVQLKPWPKKRK